MKIRSRVVAISTDRNYANGPWLTVTCAFASEDFTFRVRDTAAARRTYVLGREITMQITPGPR